ncbi:MAG: D-alanine--D-alanine ligase [Planctomycetaceae bacterium]|nr:D-alanine--D-alanine ligase [Planctomycetaceae bacterium]
MNHFGNVAVLCGGPGGEREVSLNSGQEVYAALVRAGVTCTKVVVPPHNPERMLEKLSCDVAVMMLHGEFGEDGQAQAILERRGIAYTGSSAEACNRAMNKAGTKILMENANIPTPRWATADVPSRAPEAVEAAGLHYPLFVKPNHSGSSVGVSRVDVPEQLLPAAEQAMAGDSLIVIEEMIAGREFTVSWLDGELLPVIELSAKETFYDYKAKYLSDETRYTCPADIPADLAALMGRYTLETVAAVGARDLARVDLLLGPDGPTLLEINTSPGFTSHSLLPMAAAATGMTMERLCMKLVAMAALRGGSVRSA